MQEIFNTDCFAADNIHISQQNFSGKIVDEDRNSMNAVLVFNSTKNIKTYSNISGYYSIEVILSELQTAFAEYSKLNKLSD